MIQLIVYTLLVVLFAPPLIAALVYYTHDDLS